MPIVSITRLRIRSWSYLPLFFFQALRIARQAARADGNLAVKMLADRRNTYWTSTSWASPESMKAFMLAKPHGPAMRSLLEWCDEAALVHWTQGRRGTSCLGRGAPATAAGGASFEGEPPFGGAYGARVSGASGRRKGRAALQVRLHFDNFISEAGLKPKDS